MTPEQKFVEAMRGLCVSAWGLCGCKQRPGPCSPHDDIRAACEAWGQNVGHHSTLRIGEKTTARILKAVFDE